MIGIDTNILVRYLTRDDEQQWRQAVAEIHANQPCFISNIVLCELIWVLSGANYKFSKEQIVEILEQMLHSSAFEFENRSIFYRALQRVKSGGADFSDYLIGAIASESGCRETITFDRKLKIRVK